MSYLFVRPIMSLKADGLEKEPGTYEGGGLAK